MRNIAHGLLVLIVFVTLEGFGFRPDTGIQDNTVQNDYRTQIVAAVLWGLLMAVSFLPGVTQSRQRTVGLLWPTLFIAWTVFSATWSENPGDAMPKAVALLGTTLATWRLTAMFTVKQVFDCVYYVLAALLVLSLALVILVPSIGVVQHEWMHIGDWRGPFASKQGLGTVGALGIALGLLRVVQRHRTWFDIGVSGLAFACLLGSGSRGAGIVAVLAVSCLILGRGRPKLLAVLMPTIILTDVVLAMINIAYFMNTQVPYYEVFGTRIDFTERTFIWHYALALLPQQPLVGFGLNGFWTDDHNYSGFQRLHGWVLNNFHNGYITVIVETGFVGFGLFLAATMNLITHLRKLALKAGNRVSLEMTVTYLLMFFTLNLSEGMLLRSTNFLSVLFTFLVIKVVSSPEPQTVWQRLHQMWPVSRPLAQRRESTLGRATVQPGATGSP